ncbi:MAG: tetratricopeptide repeat protein [Nitrospiraceae bacterium]|nr:MAG: tetratricopeptide repeat protein [Nitrospiraceae bacterium]
MKYSLIIILMLIVCAFTAGIASADTSLDESTLNLISNAVFEVVVPKPVEDSLTYEKPLPLELLPYYIRTDDYYSIGSAFAISPTEFVTAVHVMNLALNSQYKEVYLRDKDKNVYSIDKITKYSERKDFVVFSLKDKTAKDFLEINLKPQINQKVFAVGNALGEGIVIRDGLYTSNTLEDESGEWKWIRFSAAASSGNSGGPLLDKDGKVIGIVLLKSENENLNYALPVAEVVNAKTDKAIVDQKAKYLLENTYITKAARLKREVTLPRSYQELKQELMDGTRWFTYNLLKSLFKENKDAIFPNGKGSKVLLHSNYDSAFPGLISQNESGSWYVQYPKETKEVDLPNNGHMIYGGIRDTLFLSIQKPDDVSLDKFYSDSKLFMDTVLKGLYFPRRVGQENVKITSLGRAKDEYVFTDSYGRKWLANTWIMEFSDWKLAAFSLPIPGGCMTMLRVGQTGLVEDGHIPDMKMLTNFVYLSYNGDFSQWRELLMMKDLLADAFSTIKISFDYNKVFHYESKRLSFSYPSEVMGISEKSRMKLRFGYFKEKDKTVWDVTAISIGESKGGETSFNIARNMESAKELSDKYQSEWDAVLNRKFPFNKAAYYKDKATNVAAVLQKSETALPVLYTIQYSKEGKAEQQEMETALNRLMQNVFVYEDGQNPDVAYADRRYAYHDKGDYYQALYEHEKLADIVLITAAGYLLRGDLYKDKGDMEQAVTDYAGAIEKDFEYAQAYLGKDFAPLIYGVRGQFKEAKARIEKVLETDLLNRMLEPLLKVADDALNQKIKSETAARLFKGEALDHLGMSDEAFIEINNAVIDNPDYHIAYEIRGFAKVARQDDVDGGISDYSKAIELNPKDIIAYNGRGVAYNSKKEYDRAMEDFNKALEINPAYAKVLHNRAGIYSLKNLYDAAIADYDAALKIFPFEDGYYGRGLVFYNKGSYDKAISDYNKALELNQKFIDAFIGRGLAYMAEDKFDLALSDYNKALELDPYNEGAYINRGNVYHAKDNYDQAISDYNRAIEINPWNSSAFTNRGLAYQDANKTDLALSDYNKAIELEPDNAEAYNNRGNIYISKANYEQAISNYNKAIKINPKKDIFYHNRGIAYFNRGNTDDAIADYTKALELNTEYVKAYFDRGLAYQNEKEFERALSDYGKAIEKNPDYSDAYNNRGNIYFSMNDYEKAIADYNKAIEKDPVSSQAFYNRGLAYSDAGDLQHAISDLNKAIEINPGYTDAYVHRGMTYGRSGKHDLAISDFDKAIELNPKDDRAFNNRGYSYLLMHKHDSALSDFNRAIEISRKNTLAYINRGNTFYSLRNRGKACADWKTACELGSCENYTKAKAMRFCE